MTVFIITGLLMTVSVGGFMSLIFTSGMKSGCKKVIVATIISLVIGFGISGLFALERRGDEIAWNNGNCECGGEWHLFDIEHLKNSGKLYYYECENCFDVIRTHSRFSK